MTWQILLLLFSAYKVAECSALKNVTMQAFDSLATSRMVCEKDWYSFNGKCYKVGGIEYSKLTWEKAAKYCREDGGSLVIIQNQETQDFVRLIVLEFKMNFWIGLHDQVKEQRYEWIDGSTFNYTNWVPGEPSGPVLEKEDCMEMSFLPHAGEPGQWNDLSCDSHLPFICQKDQISYSVIKTPLDPLFCSKENSSGFKFHNSCYNLVTEKKSWEEAEAYCQREYAGNLVSVRDFSVDFFLDYVLKELNEEIWIGIPIKDEFTQKWSNGFFVGYNGWNKGKKDFVEGTCATRSGSRRWNAADCSRNFAFVCEKTADTPTVLTPTVKGSVCPSKPDGWRDLGGDMCYYFEFESALTWHEANFDCMFRGGTLASIHSEKESNAIHEFVIYTKSVLFFGLHRRFRGGKDFAWADKSTLDWTNWNPGEPNLEKEGCAELLTSNMKWNDAVCDAKKGYICSINKIAPITNLSAVDDALLGQCQKCTSGTLSIVLLCIIAVLVLLGAISGYYFKPWTRKKHNSFSNTSFHNVLSDSAILSFKPEAFPVNNSPDHYEITSNE